MTEKRNCTACSAGELPDGAKFCPNCGSNLSDQVYGGHGGPVVAINNNNIDPPIAAAVIIDDEDDIVVPPHHHSTTTFSSSSQPSAPPEAEQFHHYNNTTSTAAATASTMTGTTAPMDTGGGGGALYFKNPSEEMIQKSNSTISGGILFIQTPTTNYNGGKKTLPKTLNVGHILSGQHIDLSYADFIHPTSTIYVGTILGGIKVIVPRGVRVETHGVGILGGFKGIQSQTVNAGQDAPTLVISGLSILGGVNVRVNEYVPPVRIVE